MAGQPTQRTFGMTLLATYSPAFLVGLVRYIRSLFIKSCKVSSMGLSTRTIWLHQLSLLIRFTPTNVFCVTARAKHYQEGADVRKHYKLCTKSYTCCRSNSFPDPVVVEWENESWILQTKAIERVTMSDEKVGQLNAAKLKSWDLISTSNYSREITL